MAELNTARLRQACRIFMDRAYPDGAPSMPPKKRAYYEMSADQPATDYLPPASLACGVAQEMSTRDGGAHGYEFRLGSAHFPHLKLRAQLMEHHGVSVWVFTVNTHDAFSHTCAQPPPAHPDAPAWLALQATNHQLKDRIEDDLDKAGFITFKSLLRGGLETPVGR